MFKTGRPNGPEIYGTLLQTFCNLTCEIIDLRAKTSRQNKSLTSHVVKLTHGISNTHIVKKAILIL